MRKNPQPAQAICGWKGLQMLLCGPKRTAVLTNKPRLFIDGTVRHLSQHGNTFAVEITA